MSGQQISTSFPLRGFLGFDLELTEPGHCVAHMTVSERHLNPHQVVHGGVLFSLVDTAMGGAVMSTLEAGHTCASIELHQRFLRPVASGRISVDARVVHGGRQIVHLEARISDARDRLLGSATGSFRVLSGVAPAGPADA